MELLHGIRARVYPVGRLDYASEGLLLLTNDGDLAHRLMKATSHVPKVYLVKVAGKPDLAGLEKLRRGISISESRFAGHEQKSRFLDSGRGSASGFSSSARNDRSKTENMRTPVHPDSGRSGRHKQRVQTAPTKIRLVREADNPWYEVTLTEGKNRQIRRMFEEIGHHVEKIKRLRYGPLHLDVPPGEFRKLDAEEVERLKAAAGLGKLRPQRRVG
jgi:23S rRNA pseudouridine2605 synthase